MLPSRIDFLHFPRLAGFSEQSRVLHTAPVHDAETDDETHSGRYTFAPKYDHPMCSLWSGPAPDMSGREPNTWHQKIRSRFGAQILGRRFSFTVPVAFAGIWQTASCVFVKIFFRAISLTQFPSAFVLAPCTLREQFCQGWPRPAGYSSTDWKHTNSKDTLWSDLFPTSTDFFAS